MLVSCTDIIVPWVGRGTVVDSPDPMGAGAADVASGRRSPRTLHPPRLMDPRASSRSAADCIKLSLVIMTYRLWFGPSLVRPAPPRLRGVDRGDLGSLTAVDVDYVQTVEGSFYLFHVGRAQRRDRTGP